MVRGEMYRDELKGLYAVARIFFLLLLNCSPCGSTRVLLSKTYKPFSSLLDMEGYLVIELELM